jgi:DNA-binding XRE family transcriptional regulator
MNTVQNQSQPPPGEPNWEEVAARLRQLREALGYQRQDKFAEWLGISPARYGNAERGMPLSRQMAQLIVAKCPGVTEAWLYRGEITHLSDVMTKLLGYLPRPSV